MIDEIKNNDNRNYNYTNYLKTPRVEHDIIVNMIESETKVLDLGCGNGTLLKRIAEEKKAIVRGVDISESGVKICKEKNLDVIQGAIDEKLPFENNEFDYAVCNVTIQMVKYPEILINEMKRVSKYQVISFPNFGFYKNRIEMFIKGRMPSTMLYGYTWYNTGHLHQLSINDFHGLLKDVGGFDIIKLEFPKTRTGIKNFLLKVFPNLLIPLPVFLLKKI